ncbi:hypothetical protein JDV02_007222 [Purpureocillium takamizusanense]|uniref:ATP/GTP-binding protein n=1 Tax=Purpureocillium takamizusanense TaxID=2060973 RepID=A0A9Q8VDX1_9HYPO|nr:uncharacterized protein JDV02_007222 [Purpureocillium takamizusanense]UNI21212.1 hypothetical protein JDV02_007222 [Purpureocillium takamizusanense]
MANTGVGRDALKIVFPSLQRTPENPQPIVVMTCGISGSGKSTLAKAIEAQLAFTRLSVDAMIHEAHGLYGIDYAPSKYAEYQDEAQAKLKDELRRLLRAENRDVVLDLAFWNKEYRDEFKALIEENGGRWVLVFLQAERELLWRRITERRARRDALDETDERRDGDSAFNVDEATFDMYCNGFERPEGEGEIVINCS